MACQELKILNCGLTGGQRDMMLKLLSRMVQVLQDPALAIRQKNEDINLSRDRSSHLASTPILEASVIYPISGSCDS